MGRLQDKVTVVTGAGSGIGRGIAHKCAAEGAVVIVTDIDESAAAAVVDEIGGGASAYRVDVTDRATVDAMVADVMAEHGRIDVLVNNAGWDVGMPFVDTEPDFWDRVIAINYVGTLNTCHAILPIMAAQNSGSIVNLASDAGRVGSSGEAVYAGAKAGIIGFSKTIAREHARHRITVNVVCPGPTDTALFASMGGDNPRLREGLTKAIPFRRLGTAQDVANAVAFFASDEASFITGQTLSVSGGLTMV
ncbi:MAG TPA: glucose 1-dehydrogenase [Intrasporangiaceae bacterium]|nr:glucose 1-dehydrogenase [Intrasporangiaceae bacterium]